MGKRCSSVGVEELFIPERVHWYLLKIIEPEMCNSTLIAHNSVIFVLASKYLNENIVFVDLAVRSFMINYFIN